MPSVSTNLHGKKILITRERSQAKKFSNMVLRHGGIPIEAPMLKISCKESANSSPVLDNLRKYQWIFFTSANGVHCFYQMVKKKGLLDQLSSSMIAVVGHKTETALKEYGSQATFIPTTYNADSMAEEFLNQYADAGPILLVQGNKSRDVLPKELQKNGIAFDSIIVYETTVNTAVNSRINNLLQDIDYLTFTSPSTVEALTEMEVENFEDVKRIPCVCIGTTTEEKAKEAGFAYTIVPDQFTIEGMIEKIGEIAIKKG